MSTPNAFRQWYEAGYRDLLPIVPPDAICKPSSHVNAGKGKSPGVREARSGLWTGLKGWNTVQPDLPLLDEWHAMGAGTGLRLGAAWMLDLDVYDESTADMIEAAAIEALGPAPMRVGQWPKRSLLYASAGDVVSKKMHFAGKQGEVNNIEIPFQSVIQGIHAKTGKPYAWPRKPIPFDQLTVVSMAQVLDFMGAMRKILPGASTVSGASDEVVNQSILKANSPDVIAEIMARLPNTQEMRWDYMIKMGYAVKAALPDDPRLAFDLWDEWCSRWEDDGYSSEFQETRWQSLKGPYRVGAPWLFDEAHAHLGEHEHFDARDRLWDGAPMPSANDNAEEADDAPEEIENPFAEISLNQKNSEADVYPLTTISDLRTRPPAEWLIARHIPKRSVGFLYSVPGAGKSFLSLDMALSIAAGLPDWNGDAIDPQPAQVLYLAAEGAYGFRNRVEAWVSKSGEPENLSKRFKMLETSVNFMDADSVNKLVRTVKAAAAQEGVRFALTIVDTVSRAMPGADENLQKDMTMFVAACGAVQQATGGAVMGVHHASKAGDMRGSTVLLGAGDFVFRLERKKGATVGTLACEKQKDGPDGWDEPYRFDMVTLPGGETSLTVTRADIGFGPDAELTPDTTARVLRAMRAAWDGGEPWARAPQAKERYAVRRMVADFGFSAEAADELLRVWEGSGLIWTAQASSKSKLKGYAVGEIPGQDVLNDGIFG